MDIHLFFANLLIMINQKNFGFDFAFTNEECSSLVFYILLTFYISGSEFCTEKKIQSRLAEWHD